MHMDIFKPFTALNMPQTEEIAKFFVMRVDFLSIAGHKMSPNALLMVIHLLFGPNMIQIQPTTFGGRRTTLSSSSLSDVQTRDNTSAILQVL